VKRRVVVERKKNGDLLSHRPSPQLASFVGGCSRRSRERWKYLGWFLRKAKKRERERERGISMHTLEIQDFHLVIGKRHSLFHETHHNGTLANNILE